MVSTDEVIEIHNYLCNKGRSLIAEKGSKYCGAEQDAGDTLYSRKTPYMIGVGKNVEEYSLGRAVEKLKRLQSMMSQNIDPEDEGIGDGTWDCINDVSYAYILFMERMGKLPSLLEKIRNESS